MYILLKEYQQKVKYLKVLYWWHVCQIVSCTFLIFSSPRRSVGGAYATHLTTLFNVFGAAPISKSLLVLPSPNLHGWYILTYLNTLQCAHTMVFNHIMNILSYNITFWYNMIQFCILSLWNCIIWSVIIWLYQIVWYFTSI